MNLAFNKAAIERGNKAWDPLPVSEDGRRALQPDAFRQTLSWGTPRTVFVTPDIFSKDVPDDELAKLCNVMIRAEQHTFLLLTSHPERMRAWMLRITTILAEFSRETAVRSGTEPVYPKEFSLHPVAQKIVAGVLRNLWLGLNIKDQFTAEQHIPLLLRTPAAVRWINVDSCQGLDISEYLEGDKWFSSDEPMLDALDWVAIVDGGTDTDSDSSRSLRDQCHAANVPFGPIQRGSTDE